MAERSRRPELVCWRQGMNWAVGVEVGERSPEGSWHVTQTSTLTEDEERPGRWLITRPLDGVDLVHRDGDVSFTLPSESFRIFKLVGSRHDRGRHLKSLTRGRFLVVTPLDWERDAESAGHEMVAPEYVMGASYRAHHLDVSDPLAGPVVFDTPNGRVELPTESPSFELQGDRLADSHPDAGPLFHGSPPQLRRLGSITYRKVIVGDEGPRDGRSGWRTPAADFESLRPGIAARGAGWFFVRLYDENDGLIDSLDFRFSSRLRALDTEAAGPLPDRDGHGAALIRVLHGNGLEVVHKAGPGQDPLPVRTIDGGSCIEVPPLPSYDETTWIIRETDGHIVEIWLRIDRLWWTLSEQGAGPSEYRWTDRPLALHDHDVLATSRRVLRVRLPPICRGKDIYIGMEPQRWLQPSPVAGKADEVELPCRELGRFRELEQGGVYSEFKLWLASEPTYKSALGQVVATRGLLAENMQCIQRAQGRNIVLEVSWKERGRVPEKVLRLWDDSAHRRNPIQEQAVPGGVSEATVEARHLTPGRYLLQLAWRDARAAAAPSPPIAGAPNILAIQVVSPGDLRMNETFLIEAVECGRRIPRGLNLKTRYLVTILGKIVHQQLPSGAESAHVLVKAINEGWYCGRLEVELPSGELGAEIDRSNPVKCEYSLSGDCVTAIEDRYGDGAMFCSTCGRLYWDAERLKNEEGREHALHGPIAMFRIRWNP